MMLALLLIYVGLLCLIECQLGNVIQKVNNDVQLIGEGQASLVLPDILTFSLAKSCTGQLDICYEAESLSCDQKNCLNLDESCPHGSCIINLKKQNVINADMFTIKNQEDNIEASFAPSTFLFCPMKLNAIQNVKVIKMPNCPVTIIGASLPPVLHKESGTEEDEEDEASKVNEASAKKTNVAHWVFPVGISVVVLLFLLAITAFGLYKCMKKRSKKGERNQKHLPPNSRVNALPTSPLPSPRTPATVPPASPQTPTLPTTPKNAKSLIVLPKPQPQVQKQDDKPKPIQKAGPTSVSKTIQINTSETTATVEISPPYEVVARLVEDSPRSLNRQGMLRFKGVQPTEVGSLLPPFVQHVHLKYHTISQRRQVDDSEIKFFLASASVAFKEAKDTLKRIRQDLSRHGAIYERRKWKSFSESTYQYIRLPTTPGFTAWFAFSGEYGGEIGFKGDNAEIKGLLRKFSVPALLTVFFREELSDFIRQNALVRIRKLLPQIERLFPEIQLLGMPYPLNLIPAMKRFDSGLFHAAAKEKSVSPPQNDVVVSIVDEEGATDETQVTASDCGCCSVDEALNTRTVSK